MQDIQQELLTEQRTEQSHVYTALLRQCPAMTQVLERLAKCAKSDAPVLIKGESGVGKELAAHATHELSPRCQESFVVANCASQTDTLIGSELFGHEKGAFTGAIGKRIGRCESANGGTLFLDELSAFPLLQQLNLLRVLDGYPFTRVGGTEEIQPNFRLIAATNRDLSTMVKEGKFREDLYYRVNVLPITIPPLRERLEDIVPLAKHFVDELSQDDSGTKVELGEESARVLRNRAWPGNVRELKNAIHWAMVFRDGENIIRPCHFPEEIHPKLQSNVGLEKQSASAQDPFAEVVALTDDTPLQEVINHLERAAINRALAKYRGKRTKVARALGLNIRTLRNKINKYGGDNGPPPSAT